MSATTMRIVIVDPDDAGCWRTNLTDGDRVVRRRRWRCAATCLREVVRLLDAGHVPAFASAWRDLVHAAMADA